MVSFKEVISFFELSNNILRLLSVTDLKSFSLTRLLDSLSIINATFDFMCASVTNFLDSCSIRSFARFCIRCRKFSPFLFWTCKILKN